jgi:hypothetical protein
MGQQWRVRIIGVQREAADIDLLVQAVIALGRQLLKEQEAPTDAAGLSVHAENATQGNG